jgi:radical SAM protein with 4Fe4S-binding SPASM domain
MPLRPNEMTVVTDQERFEAPPGDVTGAADVARWAAFRAAYHRAQACEDGDFPLQLDFGLHASCNFRCPLCVHGGVARPPESFLPFETAQRVIDEASEYGLCSVKLNYINEPLQYPDTLLRVARYAKKRGVLNTYFATNGLALPTSIGLHLIDARVSKVMVSIDATTPETFYAMRRSNRFFTVVAHVEELLNLRTRLRVTWPLVRVNFLKTNVNMHEADAFLARWRGVADSVAFLSRVGVPGVENDFALSDQRLDRNFDEFHCALPFKLMVVDADGSILPCCTFGGRSMPLGRTPEMTIREAWTNPKMSALRALHQRGGFRENPVCAHCVGAKEPSMIDKPFAYHKPSADGLQKITELRLGFSEMKAIIERNCPESRQRAVALTELETAAMWAIKAVVFNDPASEVAPGL